MSNKAVKSPVLTPEIGDWMAFQGAKGGRKMTPKKLESLKANAKLPRPGARKGVKSCR